MAQRNKWRRVVRYALYALLVAGFVGALLFASREKPVTVDLVEVDRGRVAMIVEDTGKTRVIDRYTVSAPMAGSLARIELSPGDPVRGESVVAHLTAVETGLLDPRGKAQAKARLAAAQAAQAKVRAEVGRAEAAADFAEAELERVEGLSVSGGMSQRDADRARYEAQSAREALASARFGARVAAHEVELARAALERGGEAETLAIRSPVDGVVLRVFEESAAVVQAGQPLLEIGDPSRLEVVIDVLTTEAVRVAPGQPAKLLRWGRADALPGRVRVVEPSAFTKLSALGVEEQRVRVILDILASPEARQGLADGFRVEAEIEVASVDGALRVPTSALFRTAHGWAVYVARDGAAEERRVEIGLEGPERTEVRSGLEEGERVIVHPGSSIEDGTLVVGRR